MSDEINETWYQVGFPLFGTPTIKSFTVIRKTKATVTFRSKSWDGVENGHLTKSNKETSEHRWFSDKTEALNFLHDKATACMNRLHKQMDDCQAMLNLCATEAA